MADTKISALPAATTPLAGTEVAPIVQSGATKKVAVSDLTAGRAVSALSITTTNGASIQGLTLGRGAGAVSSNSAFGDGALPLNTSGADNVGIGVATLASNTIGSRNTAVGSTSLLLNVGGSDNSAFGYYALFSSTGDQNTGIGRQALFSTTGSNNTAIGYQAGLNLTSGSNCAFFGNGAQPSSATVSNEYTYGNTSVTAHRFAGGNLVVGTAGKGIDFSANTHAAGMTSEVLTWYEEGTWTPVIRGSTTAGTGTYAAQVGVYTRIGRMVHFQLWINANSLTGTGNATITGLPFSTPSGTAAYYASGAVGYGAIPAPNNTIVTWFISAGSSTIELQSCTTTAGYQQASLAMFTTAYFNISGSYMTA